MLEPKLLTPEELKLKVTDTVDTLWYFNTGLLVDGNTLTKTCEDAVALLLYLYNKNKRLEEGIAKILNSVGGEQ